MDRFKNSSVETPPAIRRESRLWTADVHIRAVALLPQEPLGKSRKVVLLGRPPMRNRDPVTRVPRVPQVGKARTTCGCRPSSRYQLVGHLFRRYAYMPVLDPACKRGGGGQETIFLNFWLVGIGWWESSAKKIRHGPYLYPLFSLSLSLSWSILRPALLIVSDNVIVHTSTS